MLVRKVRRRNQITLLDLKGSIPVSGPQDFNTIHQQVRETQARKVVEGNYIHISRLPGVTVRVPKAGET